MSFSRHISHAPELRHLICAWVTAFDCDRAGALFLWNNSCIYILGFIMYVHQPICNLFTGTKNSASTRINTNEPSNEDERTPLMKSTTVKSFIFVCKCCFRYLIDVTLYAFEWNMCFTGLLYSLELTLV